MSRWSDIESFEKLGYRRQHCLAVGIDRYADDGWPNLRNAVRDAVEFSALLETTYDFDVRRLVEPAETTLPRIRDVFVNDLTQEVEEDDLVVMFFAGHGHTETLANGRTRGYLVPSDARPNRPGDLISMDTLSEWSDHLRARHLCFVFDSCFSGTATLRGGDSRRNRDFLTRRARRVITAGGADQPVVDGGWGGHSVFTGNLLLGLQGEAADDDGTITAGGLFQYLARRVSDATPYQTPAEGFFPGHEGGDVLFFPRERRAAPSAGADAAGEEALERSGRADVERIAHESASPSADVADARGVRLGPLRLRALAEGFGAALLAYYALQAGAEAVLSEHPGLAVVAAEWAAVGLGALLAGFRGATGGLWHGLALTVLVTLVGLLGGGQQISEGVFMFLVYASAGLPAGYLGARLARRRSSGAAP